MAVMLAPLIVLGVLHQEKYYVSVAFGALFVGLSDPGGEYGYRVPRMAVIAVAGALLTLLGYVVGGSGWGWVVLAAFVVPLLAGLAVKYGLHRFIAMELLNVWFLVVLSLPGAFRLDHVHTDAWAQAQPAADVLPGDTRPVPLTRQVVSFAVIRAVAVAIAVAIAFGLQVQNADWMPVAALVAMKSSLQQSALVAEQRLAGAIIGAAVAGAVLIGMGVPHPSSLADEVRRVGFTFAGVGIAVVVMLLANLLSKRTPAAAHPAPTGQAGQRQRPTAP
jgi:hypothetical protein